MAERSSSVDISISELCEEDLPFLIEVRNECCRWLHDNREFTVEECRDWFRQCNRHFYLIRSQGVKVGYFRTSDWDMKRKSVVVGADVHKDFRRKGIGYTAYVLFADKLAASDGIREFRLRVLEYNLKAIALYKKLGFQVVQRGHHARGAELIPDIEMVWRLPVG